MTAKTKHGHKAHAPTRGADPGTPHERMNRLHAQPGRPEGAMRGMNQNQSGGAGSEGAGTPEAPSMPPMGAGPAPAGGSMPGASMGEGPSTDDEEGDQT